MNQNPPAGTGRAGKFSKPASQSWRYLIYATGEIILVVIGILIALQVNTWNEERKHKQKEQLILQVLNKDFRKNLEMFETAKDIHYTAKKNAEQFMALLNSPEEQNFFSEENVTMMKLSLEGHSYNPYNGVVNSLISSGNYELIRNDTLQNLIISWNDVLEDYIEEELSAADFWKTRYEPFLIQKGLFSVQNLDQALKVVQSPVHRSLIQRRIHYVGNIVQAIEEEPIEHYLREFVRLTSANLQSE
jgi:hypothetical protein